MKNQEVIEQEFHAAISAEKPGAATVPTGTTTVVSPPTGSLKSPSSAIGDAETGGGGAVTIPLMLDEQTKARARKPIPVPVKTKIVGELNEVEILETCFGVSAKKVLQNEKLSKIYT